MEVPLFCLKVEFIYVHHYELGLHSVIITTFYNFLHSVILNSETEIEIYSRAGIKTENNLIILAKKITVDCGADVSTANISDTRQRYIKMQ